MAELPAEIREKVYVPEPGEEYNVHVDLGGKREIFGEESVTDG